MGHVCSLTIWPYCQAVSRTGRKSSCDRNLVVQRKTKWSRSTATQRSGDYMTASMKAAVHLGKDYEDNLRVTKNTEFSEIRSLFSITQKLILDQEDELFGVSTTDWDQTPWMRRTSIHEHVIKFSTAEVYVLSWSALCLGGKIAEYPLSVQSRTNRIGWVYTILSLS